MPSLVLKLLSDVQLCLIPEALISAQGDRHADASANECKDVVPLVSAN